MNLTMVSIKPQIEHLISEYHKSNEKLISAIEDINREYKELSSDPDSIYTPEYIRKTYEEAKENALKAAFAEAGKLNTAAVKTVSELKNNSISNFFAESSKASDYSVKINNALQFIKIEGKEISDATAARILQEFTDDMETMRRFRSVIQKMTGETLTDAYGHTTFPLTFGKLPEYEQFSKALSELEEMTATLFINKKEQRATEYYNGFALAVPSDSYLQLMTEHRILEQIEALDDMIKELQSKNQKA